MNEPTTAGNGDAGQTLAPVSLLGTVWRHKKKGGIYRLTQIDNRDNVYLQAETKGCRSTWKYNVLLTWDYEQVPNDPSSATASTAGVEMKGDNGTS